jgi:hypothetical protein
MPVPASRRLAPLVLLGLLVLPGCTPSRYDELRAHSARVQTALESERDGALARPAGPETDRKIDHLSALRGTLTIADLGLAATRRLLPEADRPLAYDALEQAYDTIEWNIPLLPGQGTRAMPDAFSGGAFDINRFMNPAAR